MQFVDSVNTKKTGGLQIVALGSFVLFLVKAE